MADKTWKAIKDKASDMVSKSKPATAGRIARMAVDNVIKKNTVQKIGAKSRDIPRVPQVKASRSIPMKPFATSMPARRVPAPIRGGTPGLSVRKGPQYGGSNYNPQQ